MKVVILAGGLGTRLSEETHLKPKPMVEIGGKPIIWHIMKNFSSHGFNEFIICCGYKGYVIKEYFANYLLHNSDVTINLCDHSIDMHANHSEPWKVTLVDTGEETLTAGRLKKIYPYLKDDKHFFFTYGDGVSDINLNIRVILNSPSLTFTFRISIGLFVRTIRNVAINFCSSELKVNLTCF